MPDHKVVVNLATGLEDAERVTVAFLVGDAAAAEGKQVADVTIQRPVSEEGKRNIDLWTG